MQASLIKRLKNYQPQPERLAYWGMALTLLICADIFPGQTWLPAGLSLLFFLTPNILDVPRKTASNISIAALITVIQLGLIWNLITSNNPEIVFPTLTLLWTNSIIAVRTLSPAQTYQKIIEISTPTTLLLTTFSITFLNFMKGWDTTALNILLAQACFIFTSVLSLHRSKINGQHAYWIGAVFLAYLSTANLFAAIDGRLATWSRVFQMSYHIFFGIALFNYWRTQRNSTTPILAALGLATAVYSAILIGAWTQLDAPTTYNWFHHPPLFEHIRHLGYFLCAAMVASAWAAFQLKKKKRALALIAFLLASSMILWSGSRGAFLAAIIGIITISLKYPTLKNLKYWLLLASTLLTSFFISTLFQVEHPGLGWLSALLRTGDAVSLQQLSTGRLGIWQYLVPFILERPWLGWGGEGFREVWRGLGVIQAHNGVMQLLIEWGAVGALAILSLVLRIFVSGFLLTLRQNLEDRTPGMVFGLSLTSAMLALALVDGVFYYSITMFYLAIGLAFIAANTCKHYPSHKQIADTSYRNPT